ncbi:hypothetical protein V496_01954 [Pseudogymnoascus sp. VKM F-4515 (FW-2607)]|nr:hypothetical protein V496_01954 [Pseudogymnoascus sp. VKM F-4515 (FW-2607)]
MSLTKYHRFGAPHDERSVLAKATLKITIRKPVWHIMSRTKELSGLPVQKHGEDGEFKPGSPSDSAPPFKRPRGRPAKNRAAVISTSKPTDVNIDGCPQPTTVLRPSSSNLRALRLARRADLTASEGVVQKLRHGTKRKSSQLQETPTDLQQPAYTKNTQAEVRLEEAEQRCPRYLSLKPSLQAVDSLQHSTEATDFIDAASDSDSDDMTYYTDTNSEAELTTYSSAANAAVKTGGETVGTTSNNDVAHEAAHPIDAKTSLDKAPSDVEFFRITENANASHQAQAVEETSDVFGVAEVESHQIPTMVSLSPRITQISGQPKSANTKDQVQGLSQPLESTQSSEQTKPFGTTELVQKAQGLPLIQPFEQTNTGYGIGVEESIYQPSSIAVCMSRRCDRQQNVSPAAKHLYPPESFISTQDPHSATVAFTATDLPFFSEGTGPLQSSNELPSNSQSRGTAVSILTGKPLPLPLTLEPRCFPSPAKIVLPPTELASLTHARRPFAHPISTSLSNHALRHGRINVDPKTSLQLAALKTATSSPSRKLRALFQTSFQTNLISALVYERDNIETTTTRGPGFLYRQDLITLVPYAQDLGDRIINEYLNWLTHYTNNQRGNDSITMIGSTDHIPRDLLKRLAGFSTIYVPIKVHTHWLLVVLYPVSLEGVKGRVKVYDSHPNWIKKAITATHVLQFLKVRLGHAFHPTDWILTPEQFSQPQQNGKDSGLYLLANAKSIALSLEMVRLDSDAQRMDLRWQIAEELVTRSIVGGL